jgi:K+-transporting ATPase KdpF subunit
LPQIPTSAKLPAHQHTEQRMFFDLCIGGAMALWLGLYLIYALLHPEKF